MASNKDTKDVTTPTRQDLFTFGEYISPNPKPISLGVKLKPDPVIKYETNQVVKTECKPIEKLKCEPDTKEIETKTKTKTKTKATIIPPTPLKDKVVKQKDEIESLKAQLLQLQIENERLKSQNNSITTSPSTEQVTQESDDKHIAFNPSVKVMHAEKEICSTNTTLTDKVSVMRSNRHSTPYKHKPGINASQNDRDDLTEQDEANVGNAHSRAQYRTTPIPAFRTKAVSFKSKLTTIVADKENVLFSDDEETPRDQKQKTKKFVKPASKSIENDESVNNSFNLGQLHFSRQNTENSSFGQLSRQSTENSSVALPILTPMKGRDTNAKPFSFSWNRNKK